jgi:hypothetical protein
MFFADAADIDQSAACQPMTGGTHVPFQPRYRVNRSKRVRSGGPKRRRTHGPCFSKKLTCLLGKLMASPVADNLGHLRLLFTSCA